MKILEWYFGKTVHSINPFLVNVPILYPLKLPENQRILWSFYGVWNGNIFQKWFENITEYWKASTLRKKCPNMEFFLIRIFLYSVRIQKNADQKKLRIWTLFTQCEINGGTDKNKFTHWYIMLKNDQTYFLRSNHKIFMFISLFFDSMHERIKIIWAFSVFSFQETLHSFVNRLFDALFGLNKEGIRIIPPAVKYLFDFLDQQAESLNIDNPEVYHTWKNNRSVMPSFPGDIYVVKVKNGDARIMCDILSKLAIKTLERRLVSLLLTLNILQTFWCFFCWLCMSKCRLGFAWKIIQSWLCCTCSKAEVKAPN